MELSDITFRTGPGNSVDAELRADVCLGDRGYSVTIGGWGGTESEAREQIEGALRALNLDTDKLREAI